MHSWGILAGFCPVSRKRCPAQKFMNWERETDAFYASLQQEDFVFVVMTCFLVQPILVNHYVACRGKFSSQ